MLIRQERFSGMAPKVASNLIPPAMAKTARNCRLTSGNLRPLRSLENITTPSKPGVIQSIFKYLGNFWFHWTEDVRIIKNPLAADTDGRVYWTGEGVPKFSDATIATAGGGTDYPTNSYSLSLPAPSAGPVLTPGSSNAVCDFSEQSDRFYLTTFVRIMGGIVEESGPGVPSNIETMCPDQDAAVSVINQPPAGNHNITHIYVYRSVAGSLHRIAAVAVGTDSVNDVMASEDAALQPTLLTEEYLPIPDDAKHLIALPNGGAACISGKQVCLAEPYQLHAWPLAYRYAFQEEPTAIAAFGNSIAVFMAGERPILLTGTESPGAMGQDYFELDQTNESSRGVVSASGMVLFPAPDGLCGIGPGIADNLTKQYLDRDNWRALNPSSILGVAHDNRYYGFYDDGNGSQGGFVFDPTNELSPWQLIDIYATAAWSDKTTDSLFLVVDGELVRYDTGAGELTYLWESRDYLLPKATCMAWGQVNAIDYRDVFVLLYADGRLKHKAKVFDEGIFPLPDGYQSRRYRLGITGTSEVQDIVVAETIAEIEGIHDVA